MININISDITKVILNGLIIVAYYLSFRSILRDYVLAGRVICEYCRSEYFAH